MKQVEKLPLQLDDNDIYREPYTLHQKLTSLTLTKHTNPTSNKKPNYSELSFLIPKAKSHIKFYIRQITLTTIVFPNSLHFRELSPHLLHYQIMGHLICCYSISGKFLSIQIWISYHHYFHLLFAS